MGAPFRPAGKRHSGLARYRNPGRLSTSRQHLPPGPRRGTEVFLQQKGRGVKKIAILGAGSWGTALAIVLTRSLQPHRVSMWVHDPELAEYLHRERVNHTYLPGHTLSDGVQITNELAEALEEAQIVVGALPSAFARKVYSAARPLWQRDTTIISTTKGLEPGTH